jgi:hypothetical protein
MARHEFSEGALIVVLDEVFQQPAVRVGTAGVGLG